MYILHVSINKVNSKYIIIFTQQIFIIVYYYKCIYANHFEIVKKKSLF